MVNKSRVIVKKKSANSGTGSSGLTRYISDRKLDKEREGTHPRPLFSEKERGLTYRQADRYLSLGQPAGKEDLSHLIISITEEEFNQLGTTDQERVEAMIHITQNTMRVVEEEVGAEHLRWVAGVHLNTEKPHVHVAFHKEVLDLQTGELKRIEHLPKSLLPHNNKETGEFIPGKIMQTFSDGLDRYRERTQALEHTDGFKVANQMHELSFEREPANEPKMAQDGIESRRVDSNEHNSPDTQQLQKEQVEYERQGPRNEEYDLIL